MTLIPPYDHPHVIAGQGTAVKELIDEIGPARHALRVPGRRRPARRQRFVGARTCARRARLSAWSRKRATTASNRWRAAKSCISTRRVRLRTARPTTHLGDYTFAIIRERVARIETVSDDQLIETMRFFAERMKMVVEPTGCLAAAAVLNGIVPVKGKRVGVVVSGGNVDLPKLAQYLA